MKVYVVSEICDFEYFCTKVVFVTANEKIAKQYCEENNIKDKGWDGILRDTTTYNEYELETNLPTRR